MSVTVLSVATRAVLDACSRMDLDPNAILVASGLTREQVFDPDARIPAPLADAVWLEAARRTGDPDLALSAARALPFGAYKVLDFIVANAPTVGEGLSRVARYFRIVDPRGHLEIQIEEDSASVVFSTDEGELPAPAQQYTFAALVLRSRASSGTDWPLAEVDFTFEAPTEQRVYEEIFASRLNFGASKAQLVIPQSSWKQAVRGADGALFSVLDDHARRLLGEVPEDEPGFLDSLQAELRGRLRGGDTSVGVVAKAMGMSDRTLQRRLEELQVSYSDVLNQLRQELGREYLREPDVSIAEVAFLLGFSDQSAFGRAFKRWTGSSPRAWRVAQSRMQ
ncbi:MAG: AraC family transcriptional regulator [Myxococcales bacterium FL481]|nr:MAG: AraC family transcriptional regulator [Myxococcales bacterium FL481]